MINHLGPYKIVEQIGAGAMGQVYLAEDTRLGRKVAIKVLPADLAQHPERRARFEREARAAAALNHPNIAAVYDVGFEPLNIDADEVTGDAPAATGLHFIVQEYLEGQTLRRRLEERPLSLSDALRLAAEIAEALSAAHDAGVVHRDLKPDNVFISELGHAKVLDFGLAKLVGDDLKGSLSTTLPDSIAGRLVGTPGYMAPEQINGLPSDRRADIFAFGSMLYEMVSGKRAFAGRSAAENLSWTVHEPAPPLAKIKPTLPLEVCRIVEKCLQKDPEWRYQGSPDLAIDLRAARAAVDEGTAVQVGALQGAEPAGARSKVSLGGLLLAAIALTAVTSSMLTWTMLRGTAPPASPVMRFSVNLPEGVEITRTERSVVDVSRDGQNIVVAAGNALWVRPLAGDAFRLLPGSEPEAEGGYAVSPSFSPGGDEVAFYLDGAIRRVSLAGGAPVELVDTSVPSSLRWEGDGYIYFARADDMRDETEVFGSDDIWRVSATMGGEPELVVDVARDRRAALPQLLPGGEWLLYSTASSTGVVVDADSREEIAVESLRTHERRTLLSDAFGARYTDTGHIVYVRDAGLWAVPFNLDGLRVTGGNTRLIESVPMSSWLGTPYLGIADAGHLVAPALSLLQDRNGEVSWVDQDGDVEKLDIPLADNPRLNRDGTKIAVEVRNVGDTRIWVHEIERKSWTQLTTESGGQAPVWSADGRWVYFMREDSDGRSAVWRKSIEFTGEPEMLWRPEGHVPFPESVPDDGRFLIYSAGFGDQNDIWLLWRSGNLSAIPLTRTSVSEEGPQAHPSGRWIAYSAPESGRYEIFVQELSESGQLGRRYTISDSGGAEPMWSRDGRTLYYRVGAQLLAVDVETEPQFRAAEPRVLLRGFPGDAPVLRADYDIGPDGRFITSIAQSNWSAQRLDIVVNWFEQSGLRSKRP